MPNIITFTPRPRPPVPASAPQAASLDIRAHLEEAAQTALDAADKIIAALDQIEGDPSAAHLVADTRSLAATADVEPVVIPHEVATPPEPIIVALLETPQPEVSVPMEDTDQIRETPIVIDHEPLGWYGAGNVVSYIGIALLSMIAGE